MLRRRWEAWSEGHDASKVVEEIEWKGRLSDVSRPHLTPAAWLWLRATEWIWTSVGPEGFESQCLLTLHIMVVSNRANRTSAVPVPSFLAITSLRLSRYSEFTSTQVFCSTWLVAPCDPHANTDSRRFPSSLVTGTLFLRVILSGNHDQAPNLSTVP
jgi:hypothetical protein